MFLAKMQASPDVRATTAAVLTAMIGESSLTFDLNAVQLPREFQVQLGHKKLYLSLTYAPLLKDDVIIGILVTAADLSEMVRDKELRTKNEARIQDLMALLSLGRERGEMGITLIDDLTNQLNADFSDLKRGLQQRNYSYGIQAAKLLIPLHTIKGNARTLGFKDIANLCHQAEEALQNLRIPVLTAATSESGQLNQFSNLLSLLTSAVQETKDDADLLGWTRRGDVVMQRGLFKQAMAYTSWFEIRQHIEAGLDRDGRLATFLAPCFVRLSQLPQQLEIALLHAARIAEIEQPHMLFSGKDFWLDAEVYEVLVSVMPHILSNAVDHGIESSRERTLLGKPVRGTISLTAQAASSHVCLTISDDGRGIQPASIAEQAIAGGGLSPEAAAASSAEDMIQWILKPGFSSKKVASELSGRGIGLSAVREAMRSAHGDFLVRLGTELSPGTFTLVYEFQLPTSAIWA
jgi:two-component system chemotaxis sensor kinase CheA